MRNHYLLGTLVFLLFWSLLYLPVVASSRGSDIQERLMGPLRQAGFDPASTTDLIKALDHQAVNVRGAAVQLLTDMNAKEAIPAFRRMLGEENDVFRVQVCRGLAVLGDRRNVWRIVTIGLLQSEEEMAAVRAAGLLAEYGDTQGWPLVRARLFDKDKYWVYEATRFAPSFDGKKNLKDETLIVVIDDAIAAFNQASAESQLFLAVLIGEVANKDDIAKLEACAAAAKSKGIADGIQRIIERLKKLP